MQALPQGYSGAHCSATGCVMDLTAELQVSDGVGEVVVCKGPCLALRLDSNGRAQISTTGFELQKGESRTITAPPSWTGQFWGRTLCAVKSTTRNFTYVTGDCSSSKVECSGGGPAPPTTLLEFAMDDGLNSTDIYFFNLGHIPCTSNILSYQRNWRASPCRLKTPSTSIASVNIPRQTSQPLGQVRKKPLASGMAHY
ncbi:hypothetical protein RJ639_022516 [Escallonia herrerae]|uniref:Uncharacterized protein n=1 Tax=Escallonia herrerae TaxID=1293975 RepID=A0AA88V6X6_9ASTE|nr:hypothetical protein RJ639_022516 [Escallonia herrerae]